jgi:hypothetical protein
MAAPPPQMAMARSMLLPVTSLSVLLVVFFFCRYCC